MRIKKFTIYISYFMASFIVLLLTLPLKTYASNPYIRMDGSTVYYDTEEELEAIKDEEYQQLADSSVGEFHLTSEIIKDACTDMNFGVEKLGNWFVGLFNQSFSPSFGALYSITSGYTPHSVSVEEALKMTESDFTTNPIINGLYYPLKKIGFTLTGVLMIFGLGTFLIGKSKSIDSSPIRVIAMGSVSYITIFISYKLILAFQGFMSSIWAMCVTYNDSSVSWHNFSRLRSAIAGTGSVVGNSVINGVTGTLTAVTLFSGPIGWLTFSIIYIILLWKLIKGYIKLYFEIIERYFILTFLLLFSPIIIPLIILSRTEDIFKKYIMQLVVQGTVMILCVLMMNFFNRVLIIGGWTQSPLNYICALAFLKVATRIDTYLDTMGISTAKANGEFMKESTGFLRDMNSAIMSFTYGDRAVSQLGNRVMNASVASNNAALYEKGYRISNAASHVIGNVDDETIHKSATRSFNKQMLNNAELPNDNETIRYNSIEEANKSMNVPSTYIDQLQDLEKSKDQFSQIDLDDMAYMEQDKHGDLTLYDKEDKPMATVHNNKAGKASVNNFAAPLSGPSGLFVSNKGATNATPFTYMHSSPVEMIEKRSGGKVIPSSIEDYKYPKDVLDYGCCGTIDLGSNEKGSRTQQFVILPSNTIQPAQLPNNLKKAYTFNGSHNNSYDLYMDKNVKYEANVIDPNNIGISGRNQRGRQL